MTLEEAIDFILNKIQIDVRFCSDEDIKKTEAALKLAISALEKQIPKKPIRVDKNSVFDGNWKKICPCCGATLMERITTEDESRPVHYNMTKHCKCGQALDWSDNNA